jgi:hypothetical protein
MDWRIGPSPRAYRRWFVAPLQRHLQAAAFCSGFFYIDGFQMGTQADLSSAVRFSPA